MPLAVGRATFPVQVFGISFTELVLILVVALVVLGPQRLPGMLRTVGLWIHKIRRVTTEVRAQTGIDDLLRQEGFAGGLNELRAMLRGDSHPLFRAAEGTRPVTLDDPYARGPVFDTSRERPVEGPDAYGALSDDLVDEEALRAAQGLAPQQVDAISPLPAAIPADPAGPNVADP